VERTCGSPIFFEEASGCRRFVLEGVNSESGIASWKARETRLTDTDLVPVVKLSMQFLRHTEEAMRNIGLSLAEREELLRLLKARFEKNMRRHPGLDWAKVQARIEANRDKLWSLHEMERTGGEPDVADRDSATGDYIFYDCSAESPKGRRSLCYDRQALDTRKEAKPKGSAVDMATGLGIELLTEEQYRELQKLGEFDAKTSSWVKTPAKVRTLGGALFCDRRFDTVFVYHNGAESYFGARGFRGKLRV
jgi:hypothetical protein